MATVLFVHAHPDDESIMTGGTLAALRAQGHRPVVLTATRGEAGEVMGPAHDELSGNRLALARHRELELAEAMVRLGGIEQVFLGAGAAGGAGPERPARHFEDSGMVWGPDGLAAPAPDQPIAALCSAAPGEPAEYIAAVIRALDPAAVVTYNSGGGYGHPDHRRVHEETMLALQRVDSADGLQPGVYLIDPDPDRERARYDASRPGFAATGFSAAAVPPVAEADGTVAVTIDIAEHRQRKIAAMAAHATQIRTSGDFYALSNGVGQHVDAIEEYSAIRMTEGASADRLVPDDDPLDHPPGRLGVGIAAVLGGLVLGTVGTLQHLHAIDLGASLPSLSGVLLPWGLLLSALACLLGQVAIGAWSRQVWGVLLMGFITSTIPFMLAFGIVGGQDILVTGLTRSVVWLYLPMVTAIGVAFFLPRMWVRRRIG